MLPPKIIKLLRAVLSTLYLVLIILTIPLAFDVGGVECGLAYSLTTFLLYFVLTTIRLITRKSRYFRWVLVLYYMQHFLIPSILTLFLSYHTVPTSPVSSNSDANVRITPVSVWKIVLTNSTSIFTILEGFCSLLLIQAIGQTVNWLTVYKSDSWLIVSLIGSGCIITASISFLYRIYVFPFTIDIISASLLGSLLTLTGGLGLYGIVSGKGSIIESSLLFAYVVRCIYETFPILSEEATKSLTSLFTQATYNLKNEIPKIPPQILNPILLVVPFLASNLPGSFKTIWEFLIMAIHKLTLPILLNLAYRIGVFYAATKIIPSLYHNSAYPTISPPRTPPLLTRSRQASSTSLAHLDLKEPEPVVSPKEPEDTEVEPTPKLGHKKSFRLKPPHHQPPSAIIRLIYAYSPCIIIAVYTHLMMLYNGQLGTEMKIWGFWSSPDFLIVVHPWQFWNWVNMATTLLLYTMELLGNSSSGGNTALTSHCLIFVTHFNSHSRQLDDDALDHHVTKYVEYLTQDIWSSRHLSRTEKVFHELMSTSLVIAEFAQQLSKTSLSVGIPFIEASPEATKPGIFDYTHSMAISFGMTISSGLETFMDQEIQNPIADRKLTPVMEYTKLGE
ncbi:ICE2-domain-containing protein [Suhomyces tanzawaensis NRRL Y-17324]|uniref:ICE2-domain-containing protein n=1 Tax=Suhomyces tanzawaensis NRRL Y-17324 TaxID=984487 RepID=A0A1E4SP05_9ASCO|nr:ICE2-domain-containing protein [Suhomyces tanzawaensis NRRL Y-17324]ODV81226.1 ICE2-domain-containing protein [Suhomyces tanzawaensis NRRL Y-17324]